MKKIALFLSFVMLVSLILGSVAYGATIIDDSTDGILEWGGYSWNAKCIPVGVTSAIKNAEPCEHGWMYVDSDDVMNFHMQHNGTEQGQFHMFQIPHQAAELPENFDVEFDLKMTEYGEGLGFEIYLPYMRLYSEFESRGFLYQGNDGIKLIDVNMDNEWHTWKMAIREERYSVFRDGQEILTDELQKLSSNSVYNGDVMFYSTPSVNVAPKAQMRDFGITKYENYIGMTPAADEVFASEQGVVLRANVNDGAESVTYYAGKVPIGTATAAQNYEYTLENPMVGAYTVWAKTSTGKMTFHRTFSVLNETKGSIVCADEVLCGDLTELSIANMPENVSSVTYFVNGVAVGIVEDSPYSYETQLSTVGTMLVWAQINMSDGASVLTAEKPINVVAKGAGNFNISREYDLTFTYTSGTGGVVVYDGYFALKMNMSGSGFSYETRDGTKWFNGTAGVYRAIVSAGVADVYKDGQLAFSYYLPRSDEDSRLKYSGFSDVVLGGSGVKNTVFERSYSAEKETVDENLNTDIFYSLEFDKTDKSSEAILLYDGEYSISLKLNGGITVVAQPETGGKTEEQKLSDTVKTGYYRLTVYRGLANLFVDNNYVGAFRAPKESGRKTLRRVMSNPSATTFAAIKNSDDVFYFADDFGGKGQREPLEYWYNIYKDATGTIENGAMKISGDGTWLLDVTAENSEFSWKMTPELTENVVESGGSGGCEGSNSSTSTIRSGKFAISVRYRDEYDNVKINYDHSNGQWTLNEVAGGSKKTVATETLILANNEAKDYALNIENDKLTLKCGNDIIFDGVQLTFLGNGKFGFGLDGATSLTIDDISYVGNGKVNSGVSYSYWTEDEVEETVEFLEGENGEVYFSTLANSKRMVYTTTDCENWIGPIENSKFTRDAANLQSGRVLRIESGKGISHATLCEADCVTVAKDENGNDIANYVAIQASDDTARRWAMPGRLTQGKKVWGTASNAAPRVYYVMNEGSEVSGDITLYYTDDEGKTWKESTTVLTYASMGNFYGGEPDVVELPDGRVRIYFRGDRGFLHYTDSYDGGVTFGLTPIPSRFMTPSTCFSIERDPENDSTYYMIWEYDTTTAALSYIQQPRNRQALAVSYDGCENWEYIMEMDDRGVKRTTSHMNASMRVLGGKVYVNHAFLSSIRFSDEELIKNVVYIVDPQKMNPVKRFANAHYVEPDFKTVYDYVPSQAIIPKVTGNAMLYGNTIPVRIDESGKVQASVAARAVGAEAVATSNGVKLTIGNGVVEFQSGKTGYTINGEAYETEVVCLSADGEYLNAEVMAKIFGKEFVETASTYLFLSSALSETYISELEMMTTGISEWIRLCIEEFKTIKDAKELKEFFEKHKVMLNLKTDFTDKSFENMFDAYKDLDLTVVVDSASMLDALDMLISVESGRVEEFLSLLNVAATEDNAAMIEEYITATYSDLISEQPDLSHISNRAGLFVKMTGLFYNSVAEVESVYLSAFQAQMNYEQGNENTVVLSTVSGGYEGWSVLSGNTLGGATTEIRNGENVVTVSAFEGKRETKKTKVEDSIETACYHSIDEFKPKSHNGSLDETAKSIVLENGQYVLFEGSNTADSGVLTTVFNMTRPEGVVSGYFTAGYWKGTLTFDEKGTSLGVLPKNLAEEDELTYRIDLSSNIVTAYAKSVGAEDTEYVFLGEGPIPSSTKAKWQVKFTADSGKTEISDIGIYNGRSGVRYDTGDLEVIDEIYYSANGDEGHTMTDMMAAATGDISIDSETGNMLMTKTEGGENAFITFNTSNGMITRNFERAEIQYRVSVPTGGNIYYYYNDASRSRVKGYARLDAFNGISTAANLPWTDGQFYDIRLVTNVVGYDDLGQARTAASLYAKKAESDKWICLALDVLLTPSQQFADSHYIIMNLSPGTTNHIAEVSIKTYGRTADGFEYVNRAVNMPNGDYSFSFDYRRMDDDIPTIFTIGGADYGRTITIQPYRITSDGANAVIADVDVNEDKWYRFFGKVKMTSESAYIHDKTVVFKNTLTMYMEDSDGNVTLLFENLPMVKQTGVEGLKFRIPENLDSGINLKNIRVYSGKALDIVLKQFESGKMIVAADFLNDEIPMTRNFTAIGAAYDANWFKGCSSLEVTEDIPEFGAIRLVIEDIDCSDEENSAKVFVIDDMNRFIPLVRQGEIQ